MTSLGPPGDVLASQNQPPEDQRAPMDLRTHVAALTRFWRTVVLFTLLGLAAGVGASLIATPLYQTTTTFFVATPLNGSTSAFQADQFAQARVNSYLGVITSEHFAQVVLSDTGLNVSTTALSSMVSASADPKTVLITVVVTSESQSQSLLVARSIAKNLDHEIGSLDNRTKANNVQLKVISGPSSNPFPVSPRKKLNVAIGLLVGLGAGVGQALLRHQLDATFRTREQLSRLTGLPALSLLPADRAVKNAPITVVKGNHSRR
jgi:succinoglycan biosynthesis transport protein ExoP